ncbi:uncharacterized protein B0I36DRAFT_358142 [Microdochium trichocladiopsis]|uniref:Uncharacterized protein n=1 Tax=Microdochium trichocladiopsis TaxID=1682393 RepID=A0A9P8YJ31_9PEZI|nr:uncharacterized protein B0I36DRAFT_358142 [Microdochium trichocladiopsis]KAH7040912.1 hypothetical protein B0I36DRAFT_358142 [Microdochium trichocladiopsis]
MRYSAITFPALLLKAVLAAPAAQETSLQGRGFKLPANLTDGFYAAYFNETGHEVHELIRGPATPEEIARYYEAVASDPQPEAQLEARQNPGATYWCGCGLSMHHGDCDAAVEDLKVQSDNCYGSWDCDNLIRPGLAWYSIRGSVVAFECNLNWLLVPASRRDGQTDIFQKITNKCGWYVPGTWANNNGLTPFIGYMNYRANLDFCTDSISSNRPFC